MARATRRLVEALRQTAARLSDQRVTYRWSHFAHCNCGHLAQTLTALDPAEIQRRAMQREGDWGRQAAAAEVTFVTPDYGDRPALDEGSYEPQDVGRCVVTGTPLDQILATMFELGMTPEDVAHLERLSDPRVRRRLGANQVDFPHYERVNVIAYLRAWAELLEAELPAADCEPLAAAAE